MKEPLYKSSVLKDVLRRHGFTTKKSFGQNFLTDSGVLRDIVEAAAAPTGDPNAPMAVLEIGPGVGTLTQALAEAGFSRIVAIEKDRTLLPVLRETLADYPAVEIVSGDALRMNWEEVLPPPDGPLRVRVVANLPYYITTPLLFKALAFRSRIDRIVVMVQREVAERIVATRGKDYGALSLAVQYYSQPTIIRTVPPSAFLPNPAVDSAVVAMTVTPRALSEEEEAQFFRIVRASFQKRRKTLLNCLAAEFSELSKAEVSEWLTRVGINGERRGETLSMEEFIRIACDGRCLNVCKLE